MDDFMRSAAELAREKKRSADEFMKDLVAFFETAPLYKAHRFPQRTALGLDSIGAVLAGAREPLPNTKPTEFCLPADLRFRIGCPSETCRGEVQPFAFRDDARPSDVVRVAVGRSDVLHFRCAQCDGDVSFLVHVRLDQGVLTLLKAGHWPSLRPKPDAVLARALGPEASEIYSLGMASERIGLGIGAHAYYRRVAEVIIDRLMAALRVFAAGTNNPALVTAIDEAAGERHASDRIKAAKDLLPPILRPDGVGNPLGTIYAALSDHLHSGSEEECLEIAASLRGALEFLLRMLAMTEISKGAFKAALANLQERKTEKERRRIGKS